MVGSAGDAHEKHTKTTTETRVSIFVDSAENIWNSFPSICKQIKISMSELELVVTYVLARRKNSNALCNRFSNSDQMYSTARFPQLIWVNWLAHSQKCIFISICTEKWNVEAHQRKASFSPRRLNKLQICAFLSNFNLPKRQRPRAPIRCHKTVRFNFCQLIVRPRLKHCYVVKILHVHIHLIDYNLL